MHQTISGETHKILVLDKENYFKNFLFDQTKIYNNLEKIDKCLYESLDIVNSTGIKYFNYLCDKKEYKALKNIIKNEYNLLESVYPYLGDLFLLVLFKNQKIGKKHKSLKFNKDIAKKVLKNFNHDINIDIFNTFLSQFSLEYFIDMKFEKNIDQAILIKNNRNNFNLFFEKEYFLNSKELVLTNYKVIILDGIIQNISEIHHVLYDSSENNQPYVIFCYGTSEDVKHNIILNNSKNITQVYPISFNFDENSLNVLNDIAVLHDIDVISSNKGQTISTEVRKLKPIGKKIIINKSNFSFEPVCNYNEIQSHKNFLNKRIEEANNDENKKFLLNRYKRLFSKNAKLILPELIKKNSDLIRELDYGFKLIKNADSNIILIKNINNKNIYFPTYSLKILKNKVKSLKNIINNIEKIIIDC